MLGEFVVILQPSTLSECQYPEAREGKLRTPPSVVDSGNVSELGRDSLRRDSSESLPVVTQVKH